MSRSRVIGAALALVASAATVIALFTPLYWADVDDDSIAIKPFEFDGFTKEQFFFFVFEPLISAIAAFVAGLLALFLDRRVVGGSLIGLGVVVAAYGASWIGATASGDDQMFGPAAVTPLVGGIAMVGGGVLLVVGARTTGAESSVPFAQNPPAGWYPDPGGTQTLRYWTGAAWAAETIDRP